jgi:hypothetical protein
MLGSVSVSHIYSYIRIRRPLEEKSREEERLEPDSNKGKNDVKRRSEIIVEEVSQKAGEKG